MSSTEELVYYKEIFMEGFWLSAGWHLFGLLVRTVRMMRRPGVDILD